MTEQLFSVAKTHEDPTPYALLRVNGPNVERYQPDVQDFIPALWMMDYVYGDEWGAKPISADEAEQLKTSGTLEQLDDETVARLEELQRSGKGDTDA